MKSKLVLLLVALLFSGTLARSAPVEGAAIQGWYYDAPNHVVSLRVVNTGDVPITAFILNMTITDSNGPSESGLIRDFLNHAVFLERNKGTQYDESFKNQVLPESIPVGGGYDEKVTVPQDFKDFSVTLTVAAFADKTASAVSPEAFAELIDIRKANAAGIAKGIQIINATASETDAEANIRKYRDTYDATPHDKIELDAGELKIILDDLTHIAALKQPDGSDSDALKTYLAAKERERVIWADNAKLQLGSAR